MGSARFLTALLLKNLLGPEKTFPFHGWDYCANKTLLYKEGTLCPLHQCSCEIERESKSFSYRSGRSSSDTWLPTITTILPTDLIASVMVLGGLGLGLGAGARAQVPCSCARISAFFQNKKDFPCPYNYREKPKSSMAQVLQNQKGIFLSCSWKASKKLKLKTLTVSEAFGLQADYCSFSDSKLFILSQYRVFIVSSAMGDSWACPPSSYNPPPV